MSFIFVNRFFHPDHSATSQILTDLAFDLAGKGEAVQMVTSRQLYEDPEAGLPSRDEIAGVKVHRVRTTRFGRRSLPGRTADLLSFYMAAGLKLLMIARRGDVVIAKTDPPMLSVLAAALAPLCGFKTVNWLQDLYPEIASELGVSGLGGALGRVLRFLRDSSLRSAELNVAIGEDMRRRLIALGLPSERIIVLPNWSDDDAIRPMYDGNALRRDWGLTGKFVVGYSGNLGRAHDVGTLVAAADILKNRPDIVFLFIGGGAAMADLETTARARGLNLVFKPYQPRELLSQSLGVADVHWLSLKAGLDGLILPSKFYGIAAAGRPMIIIGSAEGEFARLVTEFDCGCQVDLGASRRLAEFISELAAAPEACRRMGANARRMLDERFTKAEALRRWHDALRAQQDDTGKRNNSNCVRL